MGKKTFMIKVLTKNFGWKMFTITGTFAAWQLYRKYKKENYKITMNEVQHGI